MQKEETRQRTACFSGYRTEKMPYGGNKDAPEVQWIKRQLQQAIENALAEGFTHFIVGTEQGWDTWAFDIVVAIRDRREDKITLEVAIPYRKVLKGKAKMAYEFMLSYADVVTILSERYHCGVYHARNRYMVDSAELMICFYDGKPGGTAYTVGIG